MHHGKRIGRQGKAKKRRGIGRAWQIEGRWDVAQGNARKTAKERRALSIRDESESATTSAPQTSNSLSPVVSFPKNGVPFFSFVSRRTGIPGPTVSTLIRLPNPLCDMYRYPGTPSFGVPTQGARHRLPVTANETVLRVPSPTGLSHVHSRCLRYSTRE